MTSLYLRRLNPDQRQELDKKLWEIQGGRCFICEKTIDLALHKQLDIDHVTPITTGGKDDASNFALTHQSCNRSKQASNLQVARVLQRFSQLKERLESENRAPNLGDILKEEVGDSHELTFKIREDEIVYTLGGSDTSVYTVPIFSDELSGFRYFFARLPINYFAHDSRINPRSIGTNISKLVEEFYQKRPQLHVALGWIRSENKQSAIFIFDGQHKVAAQIMLGARKLPVRVFIDPDQDTLITTNTNAGTTLKQVAFDKSVQRHLGRSLYHDRITRFQNETGKNEYDLSFSEKDLVDHFKGQSKEIKRYILDALRDSITSDPENKLREFIDFGGRGKERPLSYSTIEKTFYSFFIYQEVLTTPIDLRLEEGENPRQLEREQILRLMNLVAEELYIEKFDPEIGTDKIENQIQNGKTLPHGHIRAFRMSKEEIIYNWLQFVGQIAFQYFIMQGKPDPKAKLFQYRFPEEIWNNIRRFLRNLSALPLWVNTEFSLTVFGGKQNNSFWKQIFETGRTSQGMQVLAEPINLINMIREPAGDAFR